MNHQDNRRDEWQLFGGQARLGYDWWWHSLTAVDAETGEERPFFFEFFTCNPASGGAEPVFGQLPENQEKGVKPSYLMVKAGAWKGDDRAQLHRFFGWKDVHMKADALYSVEAADCYCSETESRGHIRISPEEAAAHPEWMCSAGEMSWNIRIRKEVAFNVGYGASGPMRRWQLFEMFWHAEGMKTCYEGEIEYNGRRYLVTPERSFGYADKNWGKGFTTPWVWLSSCDITSEKTGQRLTNTVFDIGGGRPKVGPVALPRQLLSMMWYEGKAYEFNFSKFWTLCRTRFRCYETADEIVWHVEQRTWLNRMVTDIRCAKADMLLVNYEAPNGERRHRRLWNGGNGHGSVSLYRKKCLFAREQLLDTLQVGHAGCEYGEYDTIEPYK